MPQETTEHLQTLGMQSDHPTYCPSRSYTTYLKELLTPGAYVDWMLLNLYLNLLVLDQMLAHNTLGHIPWDLIDMEGINSTVSVKKALSLFDTTAYNYPRSWVSLEITLKSPEVYP